MAHVYLDYNATAPIRPDVVALMTEIMNSAGNPSSVHYAGRKASGYVEKAREQVAALVGGRARDVVFTAGGTEANNQALRSGLAERVLVSATDHDSVLGGAPNVGSIPVRSNGSVDLEALSKLLASSGKCLVSVMLANNETGLIQDIAAISKLVHEAGGLMHCDAVQAAGKIPFSMSDLGVDMLSLSSHKFGGPQGVGALILSAGIDCSSLITGGGQERSRRAGTENVAGIAGFGLAASIAKASISDFASLALERDRLESEIYDCAPNISFFCQFEQRTPNTTTFSWPGMSADKLLIQLDLAGIAVSSGSACSSGKVKSSHVLSAMGVPEHLAGSAIRVSMGWQTSSRDVDVFVAAFRKIVSRHNG
jgi:cysteine desulfurase